MSEKLSLLFVFFFDLIGKSYQEKGIKFIEAEFVEMSLAPEFQDKYPAEVSFQESLKTTDLKSFRKVIRKHLRSGNFKEI